MTELYVVRGMKKDGTRVWASSDNALSTSRNAGDAFPLGWNRVNKLAELFKQQRGNEFFTVEIVPWQEADAQAALTSQPEPEPPPKRTITKCAIKGHRHIFGECPMVVVEVDDDGNPVR